MKLFPLLLFSSLLLVACTDGPVNKDAQALEITPVIPLLNYAVINHFPHDTSLFTEGFLFHNGQIVESTGSPEELPQSRSVIGIWDLSTGEFSTKIEIDKSRYFGEGIVLLNNRLYQITYKNQTGFIYDAKAFREIGQFTYSNKEGWGLTTDGTNLIMSDGTALLTYLDPIKLSPIKVLKVTEQGSPIDHLNELEFINGFLYANIWLTNFIVKIDPSSGNIVGKLDLSSLTTEAKSLNPRADVLNGIAYDSSTDKIYVTGKLWPKIYQIQFPH